jgi:hypothetical protein
MNERSTPRTHQAKWETRDIGNPIPLEVTSASFAASLERELAEAREQSAAMREAIKQAHEALDCLSLIVGVSQFGVPSVCPKCGAQTRDTFGGSRIIHNIERCGGISQNDQVEARRK